MINGKYYIGKHQTNDINDNYMGSGKLLKRAQSKYGLENFIKEILFVFNNEEEMNAKEAELVTEQFCMRKDTYNLCSGGNGGFSYINRNGLNGSDEGRRAAGIKSSSLYGPGWLNKSEQETKEIKQKRIQTCRDRYGTKWTENGRIAATSEESRLKRKTTFEKNQHAKGIKNSQYGTMWITNGIENKKIKIGDNMPDNWYKGRVMKFVN
jgi:hypothetical protein